MIGKISALVLLALSTVIVDVAAESYSARSGSASRMRSYKKTPLSQIIRSFKSWITREIGKQIFQPNYYEHIIRSEDALDSIRTYILSNPWVEYDEIDWKRPC